ncbi:MAG: hypothetical protein U0821_09720 [Chloroflexota bacterium]
MQCSLERGVLTLVAFLVAAFAPMMGGPASAQVQEGATMTVLRGEVAVIRPDGSASQPAPTGTLVRRGDEIRTVGRSGALITFFIGTELEMGEDTALVVDEISNRDGVINVSLKQSFGATLNRVSALTDPRSVYRVDAGGAVALVRGTQFLIVGPTADGLVAIACMEDCDSRTTFAGCPLSPFTGYTLQVENHAPVSQCVSYAVRSGYWASANDALTAAEQDLQGSVNGVPAGQAPRGNPNSRGTTKDRDERNRDPQIETNTPLPPGTVAPCGVNTVSGGFGVTTTVHQLGATSGSFPFSYDAFSIPDKFEVVYQGTTVFTTGGFVSGSGSAVIPFSGTDGFVTVIVTGSTVGTAWNYQVSCPGTTSGASVTPTPQPQGSSARPPTR